MRKLGIIFFLGGLALLVAFSGYEMTKDFFQDADVPLAIRIALPAIIVGFILLLASLALERYRAKKKERFKEVD